MTNKTNITINMNENVFIRHFSLLLRTAINYVKLYAVNSYNEYLELYSRISSFNTEALMRDEVKEEIKRYEKEMEYYKNLFNELEKLLFIELETTNLDEKINVMKMFNELMYVKYKKEDENDY